MSIGFKQQLLTRQISDLYPNANSTSPKEAAKTSYKGSVYTIISPYKKGDLVAAKSLEAQNTFTLK